MTPERRDDDEAEGINRQSPMPASAMDSPAGIGLFARRSGGVIERITIL